ncbi:MAG TPA: endo-1,3-alpha-glucanase family glycosylhydrolase [Anaerolineales bacterium]|nr:endo-1,3-alpha-glucanase family glycosylhydrolase [Anaerolineales bacterium]
MNKTIYRIMGIIVTFVLTLGGFSKVEAVSIQPAASNKPVYAYYYLWWSTKHWQDTLGPNYPYNVSPLPLPAKTDADGCNPVSNYAGNQLLDVPTRLVSQDEPGAIEEDIRLAKNAGLTGFWLNWSGDGTTSQTRTSVSYTRRLAEAFAASTRMGGFKNWVSYKAASLQPANEIINDLNFLYKEFNGETAWERIDGKPVVTFTGSRKYSNADVQKISNAVRDRIYLVGDETRATLTTTRMAMFDAITYYWSTQDPYGNPDSFEQIKEMGDKVRAAGKRWYAPLNPGYNSVLLKTGSCIPRKNGETLRAVWNGNLASNPDGWGFISWNEIAENSHIKPMQKWGNRYLDVLSSLIGSAQQPVTGTFDDKNGAFDYSSSAWQDQSTDKAYGGSYKETTRSGSFVILAFSGQSFSIIYKGGVTYGKMKVYVDDVLVHTLDQKLSTTTYQKRWDYSDQLSSGNHTLRLVFDPVSATINKGSLDAVIIR